MDYWKKFAVQPDAKLRLKDIDPGFHGPHDNAHAAADETAKVLAKLTRQQSMLYAEHRHSLLIVLQALDAGGKDGTISHVFTALNPQGVRVVPFKAPTPAELAHDFLWRVHPHTPGKGEIVIFNRSHYEDVLVTRVHGLIDKPVWKARYDQIRAFESLLAASGTTILKFFLHISRQEQLSRFAARLDDPGHNWKISESDYTERALWDDYMQAFEDALRATSTHAAPWFVIPANHKWFRNLAISRIVAEAMKRMHMEYPKPSVDLDEIRRQYDAAAAEQEARDAHAA